MNIRKWLDKFFNNTLEVSVSVDVTSPETEPPVQVKEPELVVGEPVVSLYDSILAGEGWEYGLTSYGYLEVTNKEHSLAVQFRPHRIFELSRNIHATLHCQEDWMTGDERMFMRPLGTICHQRMMEVDRQIREATIKVQRDKFNVLIKPGN